MAAQCPIVGISETFPCFLTLLGPAYLSISKDRGRGIHYALPLNILGLVKARVPILFGNDLFRINPPSSKGRMNPPKQCLRGIGISW